MRLAEAIQKLHHPELSIADIETIPVWLSLLVARKLYGTHGKEH